MKLNLIAVRDEMAMFKDARNSSCGDDGGSLGEGVISGKC